MEPITPLPVRPSAADREHAARVLRDGSVDGRLSVDTLAERLEAVFGAGSRSELDALVADMRPPRPLRRLLVRLVERFSMLSADLERAWYRPRVEVLALPRDVREDMIIGRSTDAELVLMDPTVSRTHARLHHDGQNWLIRDLGSRNGTTVNGLRVVGEAVLCPGDIVGLGDASYRLSPPR